MIWVKVSLEKMRTIEKEVSWPFCMHFENSHRPHFLIFWSKVKLKYQFSILDHQTIYTSVSFSL